MQRSFSQKKITDCLNLNNVKPSESATKPAKTVKRCKKRSRAEESTPSLHAFFLVDPRFEKRNKLKSKLRTSRAESPVATIGITNRSDGQGAGARFDHRTIQRITDQPTAMINAADYSRGFDKAIREMPNFLKYGVKLDATAFTFPPLLTEDHPSVGLIIIPGVSADLFDTEEYRVRHAAETAILKKAKMRGQPVLGICGGSWLIYQAYGGTIKPVEGHNNRNGMPRLGRNDAKPCNNKQMHRLALSEGPSLLRAAFGKKLKTTEDLAVNSVHSYAADEQKIPEGLTISAMALPDQALPASNCKPTSISIEAFESTSGAPVLGVQWHPEPYDPNTEHAHLMQYMAQAGQRYLQQRALHADVLANALKKKAQLKQTGNLAYNLTAVRKVKNNEAQFTLYHLKKTHDIRHEGEARHEAASRENYLLEKLAKAGKK